MLPDVGDALAGATPDPFASPRRFPLRPPAAAATCERRGGAAMLGATMRQNTPQVGRTLRSKLARAAALLTVLAGLALPAAPAAAQYGDDVSAKIRKADGRLRGYDDKNVVLDGGGPIVVYLALLGLTVLALVPMFKSARRTHLD